MGSFLAIIKLTNDAKSAVLVLAHHPQHRKPLKGFAGISQTRNNRFSVTGRLLFRGTWQRKSERLKKLKGRKTANVENVGVRLSVSQQSPRPTWRLALPVTAASSQLMKLRSTKQSLEEKSKKKIFKKQIQTNRDRYHPDYHKKKLSHYIFLKKSPFFVR